MDNHTETPCESFRGVAWRRWKEWFDDVHQRSEANCKEIRKRLYELHAEGVPSNIDIGDACPAPRFPWPGASLSRDEVYQRLLSERAKLDNEINAVHKAYFVRSRP